MSQSALYKHFFNVNNVYVSIELGLFQIIRDQFQVTLLKKFRPQIVRCIRMLIFFFKSRFENFEVYFVETLPFIFNPHFSFTKAPTPSSRLLLFGVLNE